MASMCSIIVGVEEREAALRIRICKCHDFVLRRSDYEWKQNSMACGCHNSFMRADSVCAAISCTQ